MGIGTRALELRVGALALLLGGLMVVGGFWLARPTGPANLTVYVDFPAAAGLKVGSKVCIVGVPAGSVVGLTSFDGLHVEEVGRRVYVRAEIVLDADSAPMVRENAIYTITTEGVLGERYVEISPGVDDAPPIAPDSIVLGNPSFRPEELGQHGSTISRVVSRLAREHSRTLNNLGGDVGAIIDTASSVHARGVALVKDHEADVDRLSTRAAHTREQANRVGETVSMAAASARRADLLTQGERTGAALSAGTRVLGEETERTLEQWELLQQTANEFGDEVGPVIGRVADTSGTIGRDMARLSERASSPDTSLGALLGDREFLDDVLSMTKDVKRRPWKMLMNWDR